MKKAFLFVALLVVAATQAQAVTWPAYENDLRFWGEVTELFSSAGVIKFELRNYADGEFGRFDCVDAAKSVALGCNLIAKGDSILLRAHLADVLACQGQWDGVANFGIPNVILRCQGHVAGTCVQLTP